MKSLFKMGLTLFFNQFIADVATSMCIIFVAMFFGNGLYGNTIFLAITLFFFYYISYNGAYKYGFHDKDRLKKDKEKFAYIGRGFIACIIGNIPTILLYFIYLVGALAQNSLLYSLRYWYTLWTMYLNWPIAAIFPNHTTAILPLALVMSIIFPLFGYICGYHGIIFKDIFLKLLNIKKQD